MSDFINNSIFQCDGGGGSDEDEESTSDDNTSETSVEDSETGGSSDDSATNDKEDVTKRPTRSTSASTVNANKMKERVTRQRTKQQSDAPTKRLLRSRKKSPAAGSRAKQPQIFPCPNCKKEFNNKSSVNRHLRWCKPKISKPSPRKKKETPSLQKGVVNEAQPQAQQTEDTPSSKPRGRGRPRKYLHSPLESSPSVSVGAELVKSVVHEVNFSQQRSPESSPGISYTSSESEYEQREFAANSHLNNRSSSLSIDVVNPDPPAETPFLASQPARNGSEGPVTCEQCKMTYRTALGFQNHLTSCMAYDSTSEEEEDVDIQNISENHGSQFPSTETTDIGNFAAGNAVDFLERKSINIADDESSDGTSSSCDDDNGTSENSTKNITVYQNEEPSEGQLQPPAAIVSEHEADSQQDVINTVKAFQEESNSVTANNTQSDDMCAKLSGTSMLAQPPHPQTQSGILIDKHNNERRVLIDNCILEIHQQPSAVELTREEIQPTSTISQPQRIIVQQPLSNPLQTSHQPQMPPQYTIPPNSQLQMHPSYTHLLPPNGAIASVSQQFLSHAHQNTPTYTQAQMMPGTAVNSLMQLQQTPTATTCHPGSSQQSQTLTSFSTTTGYPHGPSTIRVQNVNTLPQPHSHLNNMNVNNESLQHISTNPIYRSIDSRIPLQQHQFPHQFSPFPLHLQGNPLNQFTSGNESLPTSVASQQNNVNHYELSMPSQQLQQSHQIPSHSQIQQPAPAQPTYFQQYRHPSAPVPSQSAIGDQGIIPQNFHSNAAMNSPAGGSQLPQNFNQQFQSPQSQVQYQFYPGQNQSSSTKLPDIMPQAGPVQSIFGNHSTAPSLTNGAPSAAVPYQLEPSGQSPQFSNSFFHQNPNQSSINHTLAQNQNFNTANSCSSQFSLQTDNGVNPALQNNHNTIVQSMQPPDLQQSQLMPRLQHYSGPMPNVHMQQQSHLQIPHDSHRLPQVTHPIQNIPSILNTSPWPSKNGLSVPAQQSLVHQQQQSSTSENNIQQYQPSQASSAGPHQPQITPVIQQFAQLPDGSTITILLTPTQPHNNVANVSQNGPVTGNSNPQVQTPTGVFSLLPGLQGLACQQHQTPSQLIAKCSLSPNAINTGATNHTGTHTAVLSTRSSAPCPCSSCKEKTNPVDVMEKYKKVLPYPADQPKSRQNSPSSRPIMIRPGKQQKIRVQKTVALVQNPGLNGVLPPQPHQQNALSPLRVFPVAVKPSPQTGICVVGETTSRTMISNPNIAVVRPMENPLQKLSDQISQIESTFMSSSPQQQQISAHVLQGPHLALVTTSPSPTQSGSPSPSSSPHVTTGATEINIFGSSTQDVARQLDVNKCAIPMSVIGVQQQTPRLMLVNHDDPPPANVNPNVESIDKISSPITTPVRAGPMTGFGVKRKAVSMESGTNKSIKVTLRRKEGGDSYSINRITGSACGNGTMKSLKIKGQIKSGEQAGTSTDVVVVPVIHTVPIPDPDETESNRTIVEDDENHIPSSPSTKLSGQPGDDDPKVHLRLTHRAVIVYEVKSNETVLFRSSDVRAVWGYIFETVQGTRLNHNLPPLSYPATNIALPRNGQEADGNFSKLGLTHRAVQFLLEQLPGMKALSSDLKFVKPPTITTPEDEPVQENESGCARTERFVGRKPFDMFGWLASKHRKSPGSCDTPMESEKNLGAPLGMRYRKMKERADKSLIVWWSTIHGRGLYTKRDIEKGEMIIEYAGEVIRPMVCDIREKYYESKSIGCYMFRINDRVIDATMKGNAARFINHSCEPNCEAKAVKICGKDHILIFGLRRICRGEELTYDYKFEKEEEKIPCSCGSKHCRKYLN